MPKRRTPRQRAASRRNLEKARAAKKSGNTGKQRLLYHATTEKSANAIQKEGFKSFAPGRLAGKVFFSTKPSLKHFGSAVLSVKVPRKASTKMDTLSGGEEWHAVDVKALQGKKIRRFK